MVKVPKICIPCPGWGNSDTFTSFKFHKRLYSSAGKEDQWKESSKTPEFILLMEHSGYTNVDAVGLQVWSGALLLSDYVIHEGNTIFKNTNILELSSGTGFVGIIGSMFCKHIICTDLDEENILRTIEKNFRHNKSLVSSTFTIAELNFFKEWSINVTNFIKKMNVVLVSEVIYDNDVTNGFVETLNRILTSQPTAVIYLAVEKRFVFTLANLCTEAVHYDYFFRRINELEYKWKLQKIDTDFPQYFYEYERVKELELWKISIA